MPTPSKRTFDIQERSFNFSVNIIHLVSLLPKTTAGYTIGNQIMRSGTSVGANIEEAQNAGTRKEFIRGFTIALKEARETEYWLRLILETKLIDQITVSPLLEEIVELIKILTTIIKKTKENTSK